MAVGTAIFLIMQYIQFKIQEKPVEKDKVLTVKEHLIEQCVNRILDKRRGGNKWRALLEGLTIKTGD